MVEDINQAYKRLLDSKEFKKEGFLCSFFTMSDIDKLADADWQIDFYDKKSNKITNYLIGKKITSTKDAEVFKEPATEIEELDLKMVKTRFEKANKKAESSLEKNQEEATKIIIILQQQKKPVWNLSYITKKLNILNVKIDATNNEIIDEKIVSLLSFKKE